MRIRNISLGALLGITATACGPSQPQHPAMVRRQPTHIQSATAHEDRGRCDATLPGRSASEYDTNNDGLPDVRKVYQTVGSGAEARSVLVCREADLNHDGVKDIFRFYNEEGRTLREEEDRDFDGRIDVITYFENGEVVRREMDTNGDGMVDMRVFYRDHRPYRAERELTPDNSPDFHPDYWEFYDNQGHVVRIGWDYDHDGRADRWDRLDRIAPMRAAASLTSGAPGASAAPSGAPAAGSGSPAPAASSASPAPSNTAAAQ
jgi:hypothetical protein